MNIRRHLEFIRAAEDGTGSDPEPVIDQNALAGGEMAPEVEVTPEPEPQPEPVQEHGNKGKTPWYMQRIHEIQNKKDAVETELQQTKREKDEALALLQRAQQGSDKPAAPRGADVDFETAVEAAAEKKLLFKNSTDVRVAGQRDFADFGESLQVLTAVGATSDDFVSDVIDTDKDTAHKMFDFLAKNPERAAALVNMNSRRRVAELTRISMTELTKPAPVVPATPKPAAVSKVPAPKPIVDASNGVSDKSEDEMTDTEWSAWRKKEQAKKFG